MQRGKVVNLSFFNSFIKIFAKNRLLIMLTVFFLAGFCYAVFSYGQYDTVTDFAKSYTEKYIAERTGVGFLKIALNSAISSLLFIILCFISGTSMLGVILIPLWVVLKSYIYGTLTAFLYSEYSLGGVAFYAVILLPPAIFFIIAFFLSSIEAIRFSLILAGMTISRDAASNLFFEFKHYCVRFLFFLLLILVSGFTDAILSQNFLESFKL